VRHHRYFLAWFLIGVTCLAQAHEDTVLSIAADKTLAGIPSYFGRVTLEINGIGSTAPSIRFGAGGNWTVIQSCATKLIQSRSLADVLVSGSWYHDESTLPFYVNVFFRDPVSPLRIRNAGYSFVFNLHTSELIEVERTWEEPGWFKHEPIDSHCKASRTVRSNTSLERTRDR
jgi:hypothetical protein